jgi:CheY-like chemotaxis protein
MAPRKLLIVDDDPDIVAYLCSFLEDNGYECHPAGNSHQALEALKSYQADAILVDVMMPGRSGLDLLVKLRSDARWSKTPIVVITGNDQLLEEDCQSYLGSHVGIRGPDGVLGKPVDPAALLSVVQHVTAVEYHPDL